MPRLLVVGNDQDRADSFLEVLNGLGFEIKHVTQGSDAITGTALLEPDVVLMELLLPDMDGLSLCRHLREAYSTPIVVCSSSDRESDIARAFEAGADDYLLMPVRPVELVARLRAALRRANNGHQGRLNKERLVAGDLQIRLDEHRVYRKGIPIELSPIEFRLLACLVREVGRVVSHYKLVAQIWGPEYAACRHYLRIYIRYLRSKVEDDPQDPKLILSEWGIGYRFQSADTNPTGPRDERGTDGASSAGAGAVYRGIRTEPPSSLPKATARAAQPKMA